MDPIAFVKKPPAHSISNPQGWHQLHLSSIFKTYDAVHHALQLEYFPINTPEIIMTITMLQSYSVQLFENYIPLYTYSTIYCHEMKLQQIINDEQ